MSVCQVPQESQAEVAPVLAGVFGMLALIMVIVRIWQRTMFKQGFGWDDGLIVAALLCAGPLNCIAFPSKFRNSLTGDRCVWSRLTTSSGHSWAR